MKRSYMFQRILERRGGILNLYSIRRSLVYESQNSSTIIKLSLSPTSSIPFFSNNFSTSTSTNFHFLSPSLQFHRTLCSSPASDNSNAVLIKSEEQFNNSIKDVQDNSLPAIFYFTAVWCGPCRFISPVLTEESKKYPDVTVYKIDIDQEGLGKVLRQLYITAVPTLHFFYNGKKAAEIVGADIQRMKDTMEELYGKD